jgi:hypothetical protein
MEDKKNQRHSPTDFHIFDDNLGGGTSMGKGIQRTSEF